MCHNKEQAALDEANAAIFKSIASVVESVASNIRFEDYDTAKKQIELLKELLKTVTEQTYKK